METSVADTFTGFGALDGVIPIIPFEWFAPVDNIIFSLGLITGRAGYQEVG
jgi:hypothetical protein